ncbi:hypothetical protein M0R45_004838 [Rubus argutus]|uniref:Uncharacterized protein n=1 Tax=Rubus argutus TaxID=59490 RepID=A0AAW1YL42_RUBAR
MAQRKRRRERQLRSISRSARGEETPTLGSRWFAKKIRSNNGERHMLGSRRGWWQDRRSKAAMVDRAQAQFGRNCDFGD